MGKTFAVTGVASGIGAAIVEELKLAGHRVIGFDIVDSSDNVDMFIPLDLMKTESIINAAAHVNEPLDGLCNNAGVPPKQSGNARPVLQINFFGQREFTQALLPHLKPGGCIVNMASRAGHGWRENLTQVLALSQISNEKALDAFIDEHGIDAVRGYNLSKEAMLLWTMSETETLIQNQLRMNSISPGAVSTPILDDFAEAFGEKMKRNVARVGRPSTAEDVAKVALFLLSDQSAWLKGIDIPVDGGMGACAAADMLGLSELACLHA